MDIATILSLGQTALELGLICSLTVLALYLSYSMLNVCDLSTDGCFTLGAAVGAIVVISGHPYLAIPAAMAAGICSGFVTAILQTKLGVDSLLSGIIVNTGLYSINIAIMGGSSLLNMNKVDTVFSLMKDLLKGTVFAKQYKLAVALIAVIVILVLLTLFLKTRLGLAIRATGNNPDMVRSSSINPTFTIRNLHLCEYYGTRLHLCHVSTKEAIAAIQASKWKGVPVTCEVTPHHIWFSQDECNYRVNPPIRQSEDVQALVQAIQMGMVDTIGTDHAPHSAEDKEKGAAGMVGLETAFGVCYTKLCRQCGLPLANLSELMSRNPAAILGLSTKGRIAPGMDADLVLVDLDTPWEVKAENLHSKSRNTPFEGTRLYGRVCTTIKGGRITYQAQ